MRHTTLHGGYEITDMPGQPQMALCHSFFVCENSRGRGRAHALKEHQNNTLIASLYDFAICTVADSNTRQRAVLDRAGWLLQGSFINSRIGGVTLIYGFDVEAARRRSVAVIEPDPDGEDWVRHDWRTLDALLLVGGHMVTADVVATWSDEQCREAEEWAIALHYLASDNDDVVVPPMPVHVAAHPEVA